MSEVFAGPRARAFGGGSGCELRIRRSFPRRPAHGSGAVAIPPASLPPVDRPAPWPAGWTPARPRGPAVQRGPSAALSRERAAQRLDLAQEVALAADHAVQPPLEVAPVTGGQ